MGRPKGTPNKPKTKASELQAALNFVSVASGDKSDQYAGHVQFLDGWVKAFDGVLSAGARADEAFDFCPKVSTLLKAMSRCGKSLQLAGISDGLMSVTSEKFRAVVPCMGLADMPDVDPDGPLVPINDILRVGFDTIGGIVKREGVSVIEASLLLQANTMVTCDRVLMLEFWHGIDLPPDLVLPKVFIDAIAKTTKKLVGFGWTDGQSITFHFEDDSWIKTQLFEASWPNWRTMIEVPVQSKPFDPSIFEAVEAVEDFSDDGAVYFAENSVRSHDDLSTGASHECNAGILTGTAFNAKRLLLAKSFMGAIDYDPQRKILYFFGAEKPVRGILAGRVRSDEPRQIAGADVEREVPERFRPEEPAGEAVERVDALADLAEPPAPSPSAWGSPAPAPAASAPMPYATFEVPTEGSAAFDLGAHNAAATANQQSADVWAKAYPGIGPDGVRGDIPPPK